MNTLEVEKAAYEGFRADCRITFLGAAVGIGRKRAEREEMAMEREKVRGTERAMVRSDNMMNCEV